MPRQRESLSSPHGHRNLQARLRCGLPQAHFVHHDQAPAMADRGRSDTRADGGNNPTHRLTDRTLTLHIAAQSAEALCGRGGRLRLHGRRQIIVADVPGSRHHVRLAVSYARCRCGLCLVSRRSCVHGLDHRHRMTSRLVEYLASESKLRPIPDIAASVGLEETTIPKTLASRLATSMDKSMRTAPQILGFARSRYRAGRRQWRGAWATAPSSRSSSPIEPRTSAPVA